MWQPVESKYNVVSSADKVFKKQKYLSPYNFGLDVSKTTPN